jgi:hypothetical protein
MAEELTSIYRQIAEGNGKQYELLFSIVGMFSSVVEFDPVTDNPLPSTVDYALYGISVFDWKKVGWQNDRLQHIVNFASAAIRNLIEALHEKNLREHLITRPEKIREVDSKSMMWLAKKPGFSVKQKIASGQRMMGVFHTISLDTAENRLFKSFMKQLDDLLLEKENACRKRGVPITEEFERFVSTVHNWLKSEDASFIEKWGNTPPNNTLLNDKNYRKIWKAHLMLQNLNEQVERDLAHLCELTASCFFWLKAALLNQSDKIRFKQNVLIPDYKNLLLVKSGDSLEYLYNKKIWRSARAVLDVTKLPEKRETYADVLACAQQSCKEFLGGIPAFAGFKLSVEQVDRVANAVVSIDLNSVRPSYCMDDGKRDVLSKKLIYQQIGKYSCSSSRSKWISTKLAGVKTFSIHSIFDESLRSTIDDDEESQNTISRACLDFVKNIKEEIHCQKCLYITNDDVDDFSPSVKSFKHSMNSAFPNAEILPRSIAVLFSHLVEVQKCFKSGDEFFIRVISDDYEVHTKIRIAYEEKLEKQNPETKGLFFERLAFRRVPRPVQRQKNVPKNMERVLTAGDVTLLKNNFSVDEFHFEQNVSLAQEYRRDKEIVVNASTDMSIGGVVYERLQNISPDIPLWCDFLPKLSMKDSNGEHVLVESGKVRIRPVVGKPVSIPISWNFIFPKGKTFYEFPLEQGSKKSKAKYFAYIKDSSFPLEKDVSCRLHLTYTYGAPIPYNLEFIPISDKSAFRSVTVKWENKSHKDYVHVPGPKYPCIESWEEVYSKKIISKKDEEQSIRDKFRTAVEITEELAKNGWRLCEVVDYRPNVKRVGFGYRSQTIPLPIDDANIFILDCKIDEAECSCHRFAFSRDYKIEIGTRICCSFVSRTDKKGNVFWTSYDLYPCDNEEAELKKSHYFIDALSVLQLWNQGRSTRDDDFPKEFFDYTKKLCNAAVILLRNESVPKATKNEVVNIIAGLHRDVPEDIYEYLDKIISNTLSKNTDDNLTLFHNKRLVSAIGFAVGNAELPWQKELLKKIVALLSCKTSICQKWGIEILGNALWRTEKCLLSLSLDDVLVILPKAVSVLDDFICYYKNVIDGVMEDPERLNQSLEDEQNSRPLSIEVWDKRRLFLKSVELILALYRVREISQDEQLLQAVAPSPQNESINAIKKLLPDIEAFVKKDIPFTEKIKGRCEAGERNLFYQPLKSRISFDIKDDGWDKSIPDYIYALKKFTRGEDCSIVVRKVQDDDE